jgi:hypothetical protein
VVSLFLAMIIMLENLIGMLERKGFGLWFDGSVLSQYRSVIYLLFYPRKFFLLRCETLVLSVSDLQCPEHPTRCLPALSPPISRLRTPLKPQQVRHL